MRRFLGVLSMALLAAVLAGAQQRQPQNQVFTGGPQNETQLAQQVRHALLMLPYYSIFDDLSFSINGSVVTLQGACPPSPRQTFAPTRKLQSSGYRASRKWSTTSNFCPCLQWIGRYGGPRREPFTAIQRSELVTGTRPCRPFTSSSTTGTSR